MNGRNGPAIQIKDVSVEYGDVRVLDDVTVTLEHGTMVGIVGPNGAGKSTLFNVITGLLPLQSGEVLIHGKPPQEARGLLAYVPQRESVNWRFPITAGEVVALGRARRVGWLRRIGRRDHEFAKAALERVGLADRSSSLMSELSGGQRQRVFVARALAQEAHVLLLDEAFSGVDVASQQTLVAVLKGLRNEGKIVLLATHDLTKMAERFDTVLCLNKHVCAYGPPEEAFTPAVLEEMYGSHGVALADGIVHTNGNE